MGIAEDLLKLASHLANPLSEDSEQAWLRRSVSTAYYAIFQLFVQEAAQQWSGSEAARLGLQRTFRHDQMKDISRRVLVGSWTGWTTPSLPVPPELRTVAELFIGCKKLVIRLTTTIRSTGPKPRWLQISAMPKLRIRSGSKSVAAR